jgi:heat shock protein HslJ
LWEVLLLKNVLVWLGILCVVLSSVSAADKISPHGIESRRWRMAKYRGDGTQNSDEQGLITAEKTTSITFAKGHISGSAGCGALVGTYNLSGDRLIIQADFILAGACARAGSVQNELILTALKGDLRIKEKDGHILLLDTSGKARLLLAPY